eukprot:5743133-Amphidinium_carterae.1
MAEVDSGIASGATSATSTPMFSAGVPPSRNHIYGASEPFKTTTAFNSHTRLGSGLGIFLCSAVRSVMKVNDPGHYFARPLPPHLQGKVLPVLILLPQ